MSVLGQSWPALPASAPKLAASATTRPPRPPASPADTLPQLFAMNESASDDPATVLRQLDARHDDVLRQLEELNRQIEQVLAHDRVRGAIAKPQQHPQGATSQLACGFARSSASA